MDDDEIQSGSDILGALIMGHQYNSWWCGSDLSIAEARELVPGQNATTVQVAIGLVAAICWAIENPDKGINTPEDLPYDYIMKIAMPYLGRFVSQEYDWTPVKHYNNFFPERNGNKPDLENLWSFQNFLFKS